MITPAVEKKTCLRLIQAYGSLWSLDRGRGLTESINRRPDVTDDEYLDAVECHIAEPEHGTVPPTPADIYRQVELLRQSRKRHQATEEVREHAAKWAEEKAAADIYRSSRVKGALAAAEETVSILVRTHRLDRRATVDDAVVMGVLQAAMTVAEARGVEYLPAADAVALAGPYLDVRNRPEKLKERDRQLAAVHA